jgi:hypothetical protein
MYNLWHCWRRWSAPSPVATNVPCKSCQRWCFFLVTYLHRQMDVAGVCLLLGYYARPKPLREKKQFSQRLGTSLQSANRHVFVSPQIMLRPSRAKHAWYENSGRPLCER